MGWRAVQVLVVAMLCSGCASAHHRLVVLYWHGTPRISHQLGAAAMIVRPVGVGALATARNDIVVDCRVFIPGSQKPAFAERFDAEGWGLGWTQTDDNAAAYHAASDIVSKILTP